MRDSYHLKTSTSFLFLFGIFTIAEEIVLRPSTTIFSKFTLLSKVWFRFRLFSANLGHWNITCSATSSMPPSLGRTVLNAFWYAYCRHSFKFRVGSNIVPIVIMHSLVPSSVLYQRVFSERLISTTHAKYPRTSMSGKAFLIPADPIECVF